MSEGHVGREDADLEQALTELRGALRASGGGEDLTDAVLRRLRAQGQQPVQRMEHDAGFDRKGGSLPASAEERGPPAEPSPSQDPEASAIGPSTHTPSGDHDDDASRADPA